MLVLASLPRLAWPLVGLCVVLPVSGSAAPAEATDAAGPVVRFAPEADYGPFVYEDKSGRIQGLSVDLLNRVAELAGLRIQTLPARPLAENLEAARRGEVDLLTSLRPTPERGAFLGFTRPYVQVAAILVGRAGSPPTALSDLDGRVVAVGEGYAVEGFVRQRYPRVRWLALRDDKVALQQLRAGAVSAVVADVASMAFIARQEGWTDLEPGQPVGFNYALSFAFRKDRPAIGAALEQGLKALSPAEHERLLARWIPPTAAAAPRDSRLVGLSAIAAALLLAGALLWILQGRRRKARNPQRRPDLRFSSPSRPADDDGAKP